MEFRRDPRPIYANDNPPLTLSISNGIVVTDAGTPADVVYAHMLPVQNQSTLQVVRAILNFWFGGQQAKSDHRSNYPQTGCIKNTLTDLTRFANA